MDNNLESPLLVELKNQHKLERINVSIRARSTVILNASPVARIIRRDWNIVSKGVIMSALRDRKKDLELREEASELSWQAEDLLDLVKSLPLSGLDLTWMRPRSVDLEILHPATATWLRAFMLYDKAYVLLVNAEKAGRISRPQRWAMTRAMQLTYLGFKSIAMGQPLMNADELLEDAGLN